MQPLQSAQGGAEETPAGKEGREGINYHHVCHDSYCHLGRASADER